MVTDKPRPDDLNRSDLNRSADRRRWPRGVDGWVGNAGGDRAPMPRSHQAPTSDLDFDDRHITRATSSDAMARRYDWLEARRHRRHLQCAALTAVGILAMPVAFVALI